MRLIEGRVEQLAQYELVPIAFEVKSRVDLSQLRASAGADIIEIQTEPWVKDYDFCEEDRPTTLPSRFDMTNWLIVGSFEGEERVGGMIVARATAGIDLLEGRDDLSHIFDVRVQPAWRGQGVGQKLFEYAVEWSKGQGCIELRVETQDVNVGACRFYRAMGCTLHSANEGAYGPNYNEAQLIWTLKLGP